MADRALLHLSHLPAFDRFMARLGWASVPTKGDYEQRRYTKAGRPPVVIYSRGLAREHCSIRNEDRPLVWKFLRLKREAEECRAVAKEA